MVRLFDEVAFGLGGKKHAAYFAAGRKTGLGTGVNTL
jgi:hypothetical protein